MLLRLPRRGLNSKIPTSDTKPAHLQEGSKGTGERLALDGKTVALLERLALVDFGNEEAIRRLEEAVHFAKPLSEESNNLYLAAICFERIYDHTSP